MDDVAAVLKNAVFYLRTRLRSAFPHIAATSGNAAGATYIGRVWDAKSSASASAVVAPMIASGAPSAVDDDIDHADVHPPGSCRIGRPVTRTRPDDRQQASAAVAPLTAASRTPSA